MTVLERAAERVLAWVVVGALSVPIYLLRGALYLVERRPWRGGRERSKFLDERL
jgi:hypothetical protein